MKKEEWLTGKEIMDKWSIKPFELLNWVRKGLVPYSPASLESYKIDRSCRHDRASFLEELGNVKFDPNRHQYISAWKFLFPYISNCIFRQEQAEKFEKRHLDLLKEKVTSINEKTTENYESPALLELINQIHGEIIRVYEFILRYEGYSKRDQLDFVEDLKTEALAALEEYDFEYVKEKHLSNLDLYIKTKDSIGHEKRYFTEHLLQQIIREVTHLKKMTIPQIRSLLKKT